MRKPIDTGIFSVSGLGIVGVCSVTFDEHPTSVAARSKPVSAMRAFKIKLSYPASSLVLRSLYQSLQQRQSSALLKRMWSSVTVVRQRAQFNMPVLDGSSLEPV